MWRSHSLFTHQQQWSVFSNLWYQCLMLFLQKNQFPCNGINIADFSLSYSPNALGYEWDPKVHKPNNDLFSERSHSFPPTGWFLSKHRRKNNTKKVRNKFLLLVTQCLLYGLNPHVGCGWTGLFAIANTGLAVKKKNPIHFEVPWLLELFVWKEEFPEKRKEEGIFCLGVFAVGAKKLLYPHITGCFTFS